MILLSTHTERLSEARGGQRHLWGKLGWYILLSSFAIFVPANRNEYMTLTYKIMANVCNRNQYIPRR